jgi:hypothetical protein
MSTKKFKFVSPGVFLNEIDNSQLTKTSDSLGPVIIGRTRRGPALRPVRIESFSEFVEIFGDPVAGAEGSDVWREGNGKLAPTYAAYAAQAYLRNASPINFVRLLGVQDSEASAGKGEAGWEAGSAYALVVGQATASAIATVPGATGSVGAIFYGANANIKVQLNGSQHAHRSDGIDEAADTLPTTSSTHYLIRGTATSASFATGATPEWKADIYESDTLLESISFNFDRSSPKYLRKVFNTNPTLTNSLITASPKKYWLGESFESHIANDVLTPVVADAVPFAATIPWSATDFDGEQRLEGMSPASTNWFISQDLGATATAFDAANAQKLFRLVALDSGVEAQNNYKVSIKDIVAARKDSANPYGSFTVVVRSLEDSDIALKVVEQFTNCNLNPNSSNYVARKIGDMYQEWDSAERRYRTYGSHPNLSRIFRVVMDSDVDAGVSNPELVPFGFLGIPKLKDIDMVPALAPSSTWLGTKDADFEPLAGTGIYTGSAQQLGVRWPNLSLRVSASHGSVSNPKDAYFGVWTHRSISSIRLDESYVDSVNRLPSDVSGETLVPSSKTQHSWIFTLDDVCQRDAAGVANQGTLFAHISGSRQAAAGTKSITALGSTGYRAVLDAGINKFTAPVYGGSDGVDITESDPFNNRVLRNQNERDSYEFASVRRALDSVADPEVVECNMMAMPGISADGLTKQMLTNCESRADALAVIDIDAVYTPAGEATKENFKARLGSGVGTVTDAFELRGINSSYGCAYYPWVKIHDELNDKSVWAPPSVVAMGVMANTENRDALWFAPAGFNRGGLTEGSAGVPVLGVSERLTSKERDTLYDANINPIASFPSEGIVIFGQKTLQVTPSALDRINVRRLMIYVKKEVSRIAARLLFDQNVQTTWERFIKQVTPFLEGVKIGFGLSDFKVVLDSSTTTPDMVDRNIMYAKVFLKPAKAVEFIAVDFVITNTGAAFED